jgi:hypothetical protein
MQIIVLGMHRSGTSMVTRLVNMMGAYLGPESESMGYAPDNPKGFWERWDVMRLNDRLLELNGCSWDRVGDWKFDEPASIAEDEETKLRTIVIGMDAFRPWVLKDPRMCLTLPYWAPALEVPVALIVHRDPLEVADSLSRRNGLEPSHGIALWEYSAVGILAATRGMECLYLGMHDILSEPVGSTRRLFEAFERLDVRGLRMPSDREILAFVEPSLATSGRLDAAALELSLEQRDLVSLITGRVGLTEPPSVSQTSIDLMRAAQPAG